MTQKYFNYISYSQWIFYIIGSYKVFTESLFRGENYLSEIGFGIFLIGIGMAVGSLSSIDKLSKQEKIYFSDPKKFSLKTRSIFVGVLLGLLVSLFFISIKFYTKSTDSGMIEQYTNLGYGCLSMSFGFIFELKQMHEKSVIYKQKSKMDITP